MSNMECFSCEANSRRGKNKHRSFLTPHFSLLFLYFCLLSLSTPAQTSWRDSLSILSRQIELRPQSVDLRLRKAAVNIELGQWDYAAEEYGRVLDMDSHCPAALFFRAYVNVHQRRYELAQADYEHLLRLVPRHFDARLGLAVTLQHLGKEAEALDQLNILVETAPDSASAFAARASMEQQRHLYVPALYDWEQALKLRPDELEYQLGQYATLCAMHRRRDAQRIEQQLKARGVPQATLKQLKKEAKRK